ncbi:MAG: hypothetical protein ACLRT4_18085 [Thomasclavelia sp.]
MKIETNIGLTLEVDDNLADDWEFVEMLAETEENPTRFILLVKRMIGETQYKILKEEVRRKEGKVSTTTMIKIIEEILEKSGQEIKN